MTKGFIEDLLFHNVLENCELISVNIQTWIKKISTLMTYAFGLFVFRWKMVIAVTPVCFIIICMKFFKSGHNIWAFLTQMWFFCLAILLAYWEKKQLSQHFMGKYLLNLHLARQERWQLCVYTDFMIYYKYQSYFGANGVGFAVVKIL